MKTLLTCLILSIPSLSTYAQTTALYPFKQGDHWGYIDGNGKEKIPALYRSVGKFSEGLAPIRQYGTYGYINASGIQEIPDGFDYAEPFSNGIATAFFKGKPYLIDRKGKPLFEHTFIQIAPSGQDKLWIVQSLGKHFGIINQSGNLILDTIYSRIDEFQFGKAVIHKKYSSRRGSEQNAAIVNTKGVILLPFGTFESLAAIREGYFVGRYKSKSDDEKREVLIDPNGKPVFSISSDEWYMLPDEFRSGASPISIFDKRDNSSTDTYSGVVDNKGAVLYGYTSWDKITPFSHNRAFVKYKTKAESYVETWAMIDKKGHRIGNRFFSDVCDLRKYSSDERNDVFQNSIAFVQTDGDKWGVIDTNGNYIIQPINLDSATGGKNVRVFNRAGDILVLQDEVATESGAEYLYGFWDTKRQVLVGPGYHDILMESDDQLIRVITSDSKLAYLERQGKLVWKETAANITNKPMDIDYMNRGYFYASSPNRQDLAGIGGWGGSDNASKSLKDDVHFKHNDLSVVISNTDAPKENVYKGRKVYLANTSHETMYFPAQDSRLYMNVQAKDQDGSWKDIEYLPASWCGNSYHTLALSPNEYWDFVMPVYEGVMKTKLRIKLVYRYTPKLYEGNDNEVLYSNEIDGNINPAQFWRKREYFSQGLMDPYDE